MVMASGAPVGLTWNFNPTLLLGIMLLAGGYLYAIGPLRQRANWGEPAAPGQVTFYLAGVAVLALALMSPLDALGDEYLFSAHMVQHMLIAVVAAPLLLLGLPGWLWERLLPTAGIRWALRWLALPAVAFGLFNADLWLWHVPTFYDAALASEPLHIVEHLSFIAFGMLFWLPILGPERIVARIGRGTGVLYLFLACQPMVVLGALLTFASYPFYAPYIHAPRLWGTTPLGDQQLGGLIMWMPTNIPYLIGLSALFFAWVGERDRGERAPTGETDETPYQLFPSAPAVEATGGLGRTAASRPGAEHAEGGESLPQR
ncbi:MAG: cytochrome c oxidase assembly protein [Ktedonobacterales bacterium]|nr:cytochrome c oxidase assembly protein [Ktedonobacterales bacterium]